jgi:phage-related protein
MTFLPAQAPDGSGTVLVNPDGTAVVLDPADTVIFGITIFRPGMNPDAGKATFEENADLYEHSFGDSYEARIPKGINSVKGTMPVTWSWVEVGMRDEIIGFIRARSSGEPFWYQLPDDFARLWTCKRWASTPGQYPLWAVTLQLKRCFDPVATS